MIRNEDLLKQEQIITELAEWCKILLDELSQYREVESEEEKIQDMIHKGHLED